MKKIYALVMTVAFAVAVTPEVMAADTAKKSELAEKTEAVKADDIKAATPADTKTKSAKKPTVKTTAKEHARERILPHWKE